MLGLCKEMNNFQTVRGRSGWNEFFQPHPDSGAVNPRLCYFQPGLLRCILFLLLISPCAHHSSCSPTKTVIFLTFLVDPLDILWSTLVLFDWIILLFLNILIWHNLWIILLFPGFYGQKTSQHSGSLNWYVKHYNLYLFCPVMFHRWWFFRHIGALSPPAKSRSTFQHVHQPGSAHQGPRSWLLPKTQGRPSYRWWAHRKVNLWSSFRWIVWLKVQAPGTYVLERLFGSWTFFAELTAGLMFAVTKAVFSSTLSWASFHSRPSLTSSSTPVQG